MQPHKEPEPLELAPLTTHDEWLDSEVLADNKAFYTVENEPSHTEE